MRGRADMPASGAALPLLLASLLTASLRVVSADFPLLADVVLDVCGTSTFQIGPESPCQFHLLSFSMAWSECQSFYPTDLQAFTSCLRGCTPTDVCRKVCGGGPTDTEASHCYAECSVVTGCAQQGLNRATGIVSAEREVTDCFSHVPSGTNAASSGASFLQRGRSRAWKEFARSLAKPLVDFDELFPVGCEVKKKTEPRMHLPQAPDGHGSKPITLPEDERLPAFFAGMRKVVQDRQASATTFPPSWHAEHLNAFVGSEAAPGPALPSAVQTPNLPAYFQPAEAQTPSAAAQAESQLRKTWQAPPTQPKETQGWW